MLGALLLFAPALSAAERLHLFLGVGAIMSGGDLESPHDSGRAYTIGLGRFRAWDQRLGWEISSFHDNFHTDHVVDYTRTGLGLDGSWVVLAQGDNKLFLIGGVGGLLQGFDPGAPQSYWNYGLGMRIELDRNYQLRAEARRVRALDGSSTDSRIVLGLEKNFFERYGMLL